MIVCSKVSLLTEKFLLNEKKGTLNAFLFSLSKENAIVKFLYFGTAKQTAKANIIANYATCFLLTKRITNKVATMITMAIGSVISQF